MVISQYLNSLNDALTVLRLDTPIPLGNLLYRLSVFPRGAVSDNLALVVKDKRSVKISTLASVWYYDDHTKKQAAQSWDYRYWFSVGTMANDLNHKLLPPAADLRQFREILHDRERFDVPLAEQDLPNSLRYLYSHYEFRTGFNARRFLNSRASWQREYAVQQVLSDYGCELDTEISDVLEEIVR